MSKEKFIIDKNPPQDENGFVRPLVVHGSYLDNCNKSCSMCMGCETNEHHHIWPQPLAPEEIKKATRRRLFFRPELNLPDISKEPYSELYVTRVNKRKICSNYHTALHKIQNPTLELPDKETVQQALYEFDLYEGMIRASQSCRSLIKHRNGLRFDMEEVDSLLRSKKVLEHNLREFPNEVLFPVIGRYCVTEENQEFINSQKHPTVFKPEVVKDRANRAIEFIDRHLEYRGIEY